MNNDGHIDYDEFVIAAYDRVNLLSEENLKVAFSIIDSNKDGSISLEELKQTFSNGALETLTESNDIKNEQNYW